MKSMRKRSRILIFIILLLSISIGYALLYTDLKFSGTATIQKQTWDVYFDNIQVTPGSKTPRAPATITSGNPTQITYNVYLENPGDFYEFTVDAVNNGSIDAMITDISVTNNGQPLELPDHVAFTYKYASGRIMENYNILAKKTNDTPTRRPIKVRIEFRDDITANDLIGISELNLNIRFGITYSQATDEATDPDSPQ